MQRLRRHAPTTPSLCLIARTHRAGGALAKTPWPPSIAMIHPSVVNVKLMKTGAARLASSIAAPEGFSAAAGHIPGPMYFCLAASRNPAYSLLVTFRDTRYEMPSCKSSRMGIAFGAAMITPPTAILSPEMGCLSGATHVACTQIEKASPSYSGFCRS